MTFDEIVERVQSLPQAKIIPEFRIKAFCRKIMNLDKPPEFYIDRLRGVGGSEVGAVVYRYYGGALDKSLSSQFFKDAQAIAREKLLLALPHSTNASKRGNQIEPFIRSLLETKFPNLRRKAELITLAAQHKHSKYMLGNPDDIFDNPSNGQIILFDYKSSLLTDQENESFSNIAQLNHYSETLRSHGVDVTGAFTAKLKAANEDLFNDIIAAYDNRHKCPSDYQYWVNAILNNKLSSVKLNITQVAITPQFGQICAQAVERFMNEFVNSGKLLAEITDKTLILDDEIEEATRLEGLFYHITSAEKAVEVIKNRVCDQIQEFRKSIGQPFDWPEKFPIKVREKISINEAAALEALELSGFDTKHLYVKSDKGEIDQSKLLSRFIELGGTIDDSVIAEKIPHEKLVAALTQCNLREDDFKVSTKVSSSLSRSLANSDQNFSEKADWAESLYRMVNTNTASDIANLEETTVKNNSEMGVN